MNMTNADQLRRYLKRIEIDGQIVVNEPVARKIIDRCQRWIGDKNQRNYELINSMTFDQWCEQVEVLDELWDLCQSYRLRLDKKNG